MTRLLHVHVNHDIEPTLMIRDDGRRVLKRALPVRSQIFWVIHSYLLNINGPARHLKQGVASRPFGTESHEFSFILGPRSSSFVKKGHNLQKKDTKAEAKASKNPADQHKWSILVQDCPIEFVQISPDERSIFLIFFNLFGTCPVLQGPHHVQSVLEKYNWDEPLQQESFQN